MTSVTTDTKGIATSKELGLGTYYIKEKTAPSGYQQSSRKISFKITKHKEVVKKRRENTPSQEKSDSGKEEKIVSNPSSTPVKT